MNLKKTQSSACAGSSVVDFFCLCYASIKNRNLFLQKIRFYSLLRFTVRTIANIFLPIYFKLTAKPCLPQSDKSAPIVSLTTFPKRGKRVWIVIESLMRQTVKPKQIILWLSRQQYENMEAVPKSLRRMQRRGLKIEIRDGDIRSHKKYFYAFTELKGETIITVDDDIIYPSYTVKKLMQLHVHSPNSVCARFVKEMKYSNTGELAKYVEWEGCRVKSRLFFGSGGGTLFPSSSIREDMLKISDIMAICPTADDVWLNAMVKIGYTNILKTNEFFSILPVMNFSDVTLSSINNGLHQNDVQIEKVRRFCMNNFGHDPFRLKRTSFVERI